MALIVRRRHSADSKRRIPAAEHSPVGSENLCHLAGCSTDRWMLGPASGTCEAVLA